jgi:uncharacterized protein YneF (UPF0154 family)
MRRTRWLQALKSLGLEFWLPLPLLGLVFWIGGGLVTDRILSRSYYTKDQLKVNPPLQRQPVKVVLAIKVEINYSRGFSRVKVKTANSALKQLEFEFPLTETLAIEAAISRELGLSSEQVRELVHYQVDYR